MADVFISYKSDRRPAIEHLAEILADHGYTVWFDYGLLTGSDFSKQIESEIREAKIVVVVWCKRSASSDWVRSEARFAKRMGKFCPVKLEDCELPIEFDGDQTIDLSEWSAEPRPFEPGELLREVGRTLARLAKPDVKALERAQQLWTRYGKLALGEFPVVAPVSAREGPAPDFGVTSERAAPDTKLEKKLLKNSNAILSVALLTTVALAVAVGATIVVGEFWQPPRDRSREAFVSHGKRTLETSINRMSNERVTIRQFEASKQAASAQADLLEAIKVAQEPPDSLVPRAVGLAKRHFLGLPLNQSTALVVDAALDAPSLTPALTALLKAALLDGSVPQSMLIDALPPEALPPLEAVDAQAQLLLADASHEMKFFGHMVRAAYHFRRASNGGLQRPPKPHMDWESGCKDLVEEATAALELKPLFFDETSTDPQASGLNLRYWRGQCWRRHGEPLLAQREFAAMLRVTETDAIPSSSPLKYQSFHGMGVVMTTLLDIDSKSPAQRREEATRAVEYLNKAGAYRIAAGATDVGAASSWETIGLLLLKNDSPEGLAEVLDHTQGVGEILSSTWNLVAQLAAIRALQALDEGQRAIVAEDKYSDVALEELAFYTLAEIAYQPPSSLPLAEFRHILDVRHHPALDEATACIGEREGCYRLTRPSS